MWRCLITMCRLVCAHKDCRKHTYVTKLDTFPTLANSAPSGSPHKVTQYKKGKDSLAAQGKRRYDRKQSGYGGQTKPVFHKKVCLGLWPEVDDRCIERPSMRVGEDDQESRPAFRMHRMQIQDAIGPQTLQAVRPSFVRFLDTMLNPLIALSSAVRRKRREQHSLS
jgi:ribosomal protein L44E